MEMKGAPVLIAIATTAAAAPQMRRPPRVVTAVPKRANVASRVQSRNVSSSTTVKLCAD